MWGIARSWEGGRSEIKRYLGSNNTDLTTFMQVHPLISLCFSWQMLKRVFISAVQDSPSLRPVGPDEHICPAPPPAGYFWMFTIRLAMPVAAATVCSRDWHNWPQRCHRHPGRRCCVLVNPCLPSALRFLQEYWLVLFIHTDVLWSIVSMPECMQNRNFFVRKSRNTIKYSDFCPAFPKVWWGWTGSC